jgi:hypothetical protein
VTRRASTTSPNSTRQQNAESNSASFIISAAAKSPSD